MGTVDVALAHAARLTQTRPDLALLQAQEVLRSVPGHPRALLLIGQAQRLAGDGAGARATLAALAAAEPMSAATQMELGLTLGSIGESEAAIVALRRAVALKPDLAEAWTALAELLAMDGQDDAADRAHLAAVRAGTHDPALVRAATALIDGDLPAAEHLLRDRLRARPSDVAAIRMMAELAVRIGRIQDAITLLGRALALSPGFAAARELLARTLHRANRPAEALVELDRLVAGDAANPSLAMLRAALLVRIGDQVAAAGVYRDVLARHPRQPKGWMSYAHVLKTIGRRDEAIAAYRTAITLQPGLGEVWWSLANLKTFSFTPADVDAMRAALAQAPADEDRLHLDFALGKALEDAGADADAFAAYEAGNRVRRALLAYDADETHDQCVRQARLFTPAFFEARRDQGCPAPDPIFVVGLPRSGSTLIEQILASHSQVEGTTELPEMMQIAARLAGRLEDGTPVAYPEMLAALPAERLRALGEEYLARTRVNRHEAKPFFVDKMPNNWMHAGLIRLILPNAKIVDARRHPLGSGWSCYKQHFSRGQGFTYDLAELGRYCRDYTRFMAHLDAALPGHVHRVTYERMVADTETEVRALLAYCGLPFEPACLAFHRNDRAVRTPSSEQVRQPIFTDGVDHWRRFAPWLAPLADTLGAVATAYPAVPGDLLFPDDGHQTRTTQGMEEKEP